MSDDSDGRIAWWPESDFATDPSVEGTVFDATDPLIDAMLHHAVTRCPNEGCPYGVVNTENAVSMRRVDGGWEFSGVPCHECGSTFTMAITGI